METNDSKSYHCNLSFVFLRVHSFLFVLNTALHFDISGCSCCVIIFTRCEVFSELWFTLLSGARTKYISFYKFTLLQSPPMPPSSSNTLKIYCKGLLLSYKMELKTKQKKMICLQLRKSWPGVAAARCTDQLLPYKSCSFWVVPTTIILNNHNNSQ